MSDIILYKNMMTYKNKSNNNNFLSIIVDKLSYH